MYPCFQAKLAEQDIEYIPLMAEREAEYQQEMAEKMTKFMLEHAARVIQNAWREVLANRAEKKRVCFVYCSIQNRRKSYYFEEMQEN